MIQTTSSFPNAAISEDESILADISEPSKNIAIYQRNIDQLGRELHQLTEQKIEFRASGSVADILSQLRDYSQEYLPPSPSLIEDVTHLLGLFQQTTQASSFRVFLATVSTNMCRKFHTDVNELRMLCTYLGPGTLWAPDEAVEPVDSLARGKSREITVDLSRAQQASTGDVVILKGALYPESNPILHRSPTIEENGDKRLLLRIDINESLDLLY